MTHYTLNLLHPLSTQTTRGTGAPLSSKNIYFINKRISSTTITDARNQQTIGPVKLACQPISKNMRRGETFPLKTAHTYTAPVAPRMASKDHRQLKRIQQKPARTD